MAEHNVQINKYVEGTDSYDQLYPQPMKHASTHGSGGSDPITPANIGAVTKQEFNTHTSNQNNPHNVTPAQVGLFRGIIVMWSGSTSSIPSGWALCNGSNGTPNLMNRFVVGAGSSYSVGATGGEATHTLTTNEMPSHTHSNSNNFSINEAGGHTHNVRLSNDRKQVVVGLSSGIEGLHGPINNVGLPEYDDLTENKAGAHTHIMSGEVTINSTGGNVAHNNLPPYYALCYIMKL